MFIQVVQQDPGKNLSVRGFSRNWARIFHSSGSSGPWQESHLSGSSGPWQESFIKVVQQDPGMNLSFRWFSRTCCESFIQVVHQDPGKNLSLRWFIREVYESLSFRWFSRTLANIFHSGGSAGLLQESFIQVVQQTLTRIFHSGGSAELHVARIFPLILWGKGLMCYQQVVKGWSFFSTPIHFSFSLLCTSFFSLFFMMQYNPQGLASH